MRREVRDGVVLHHFGFSNPTRRVVAGVSGRHGGVSDPPYDTLNLGLHVGDEGARVLENRRRLCAAVDVDPLALVLGNQVHGNHVAVVPDVPAVERSPVGDADALVTAARGVLIAVQVADCVPIVVHDPVRDVIAVVHAGWRGTVARIARRTVQVLRDEFGSAADDLVAGVGPSIGPGSYEVGEDVLSAARDELGDVPYVRDTDRGKGCFDLWEANVQQLIDSGLRRERIECAGIDTRTNTDEFFSDRAARPCGRFAAFALLP
jgi:YfiH family protein